MLAAGGESSTAKTESSDSVEAQYLGAVRRILDGGVLTPNRTGVTTFFGAPGLQLRASLTGGSLPLFTTKLVKFSTVLEELLWFMRGSTDVTALGGAGVHIWDSNATRDFLDSRCLHHLREGDIGPGYGYQWRYWGRPYKSCDDTANFREARKRGELGATDHKDAGTDQLVAAINKLLDTKTGGRYDRRIIVSAWNVSDINEMALPPCHLMFQFVAAPAAVAGGPDVLHCVMTQRSGDMGLGVPFNVASYAMLTHIVADITGMQPGELVVTVGNPHVYVNHKQPLEKQLSRDVRPAPTVRVPSAKLRAALNADGRVTPASFDAMLDTLTAADFEVVNYNPHGFIRMEMAV